MLTVRQARELEPGVKTAAAILSRRTGLDEDEAMQEIWLGILEAATRRGPDFLNQKAGYIVQGGVFWARNEWRRRHQRQSRELPEEEGLHKAADDDLFAQAVSKDHISELMRNLAGDSVAKALVAGVLRGEKKKVIARRAGVSPQAISSARHRIKTAMREI